MEYQDRTKPFVLTTAIFTVILAALLLSLTSYLSDKGVNAAGDATKHIAAPLRLQAVTLHRATSSTADTVYLSARRTATSPLDATTITATITTDQTTSTTPTTIKPCVYPTNATTACTPRCQGHDDTVLETQQLITIHVPHEVETGDAMTITLATPNGERIRRMAAPPVLPSTQTQIYRSYN